MVADKGENKERIVLGKASMKVFKTQVAAMRIYKKTYKTKKEILGRFSKEIAEEIGKKFKAILDEEKPNIKEAKKLQKDVEYHDSIVKICKERSKRSKDSDEK